MIEKEKVYSIIHDVALELCTVKLGNKLDAGHVISNAQSKAVANALSVVKERVEAL